MTTIIYEGKGPLVVLGKYMYPGDIREVSKKQAKDLAKASKDIHILDKKASKKEAKAAPEKEKASSKPKETAEAKAKGGLFGMGKKESDQAEGEPTEAVG